ncbi:MAG: hypothetical protein Q8P18_29745 [Pseudomonadota bacterium]|nr:hypothetical protein [Pseudomonadota bacterium]
MAGEDQHLHGAVEGAAEPMPEHRLAQAPRFTALTGGDEEVRVDREKVRDEVGAHAPIHVGEQQPLATRGRPARSAAPLPPCGAAITTSSAAAPSRRPASVSSAATGLDQRRAVHLTNQ